MQDHLGFDFKTHGTTNSPILKLLRTAFKSSILFWLKTCTLRNMYLTYWIEKRINVNKNKTYNAYSVFTVAVTTDFTISKIIEYAGVRVCEWFTLSVRWILAALLALGGKQCLTICNFVCTTSKTGLITSSTMKCEHELVGKLSSYSLSICTRQTVELVFPSETQSKKHPQCI